MSTLLPKDKLVEDMKDSHEYNTIWNSEVGKDCVNLNDSLARWLTNRLMHLSLYGNTHPEHLSPKAWELKLQFTASALHQYNLVRNGQIKISGSEYEDVRTNAKKAIHWVADNFDSLFD